ncbi:MAG: hypothetical protein M4579_001013 [Chaenotheca gracillima]|nr:MAG: hypothetical protein M4579_001013 [Chaenotheca gracillima]
MRTLPIFQIFYRTTFTVLFIVLIALLLITPGDAIRQALNKKQLYYVFIIAGVYVLTLILAILIYASRLYTNHSVLAGIPKGWIPVGKGDVSNSVRRMITEGLTRSAVIAWDSRPKHLAGADEDDDRARRSLSVRSSWRNTGDVFKMGRKSKKARKHENEVAATPLISAAAPPWGHISHRGWSSPSSPDLPDLPYRSVIVELPHLIEAKAVSLAPPDPNEMLGAPGADPASLVPDARAVLLLQRPATMGLRDYLSRLAALKLIDPPSLCVSFLAHYEKARFSTVELSEESFRRLMASFANILEAMTKLDERLIAEIEIEDGISQDSVSLCSSISRDYEDVDEPSAASSSSRSQISLGSTASEGTIRTAPSFPYSKRSRVGSARNRFSSAASAARSVSASRNLSNVHDSEDSLPSTSSEGSVIRLSRPEDGTTSPYTFTLPE